MQEKAAIQFAENPEDRCPVVLIVDVSPSMHDKMSFLNEGYSTFLTDLIADPLASLRVDLAIITCGDGITRSGFSSAEEHSKDAFEIDDNGSTPLGEAVNAALDELEMRKQEYKRGGINYYRPWLWIMSDGEPTDDWKSAAARARQSEQDKKVQVYCVGIGDDANLQTLREFSDKTAKMDKVKFREMFKWLSASVSRAASQPKPTGQPVQNDPLTWATYA